MKRRRFLKICPSLHLPENRCIVWDYLPNCSDIAWGNEFQTLRTRNSSLDGVSFRESSRQVRAPLTKIAECCRVQSPCVRDWRPPRGGELSLQTPIEADSLSRAPSSRAHASITIRTGRGLAVLFGWVSGGLRGSGGEWWEKVFRSSLHYYPPSLSFLLTHTLTPPSRFCCVFFFLTSRLTVAPARRALGLSAC